MAYSAEVYPRSDGLWDWRLLAANGEIVAASGGQGFTERNDAAEAVQRVQPGVVVSYPEEPISD